MQVKIDGERMVGEPMELKVVDQQPDEMTPYERLIGDAIQGDQALFARQDVVEEGWRIVEKIIGNSVPVHPYKPGMGPGGGQRRAPALGWMARTAGLKLGKTLSRGTRVEGREA